MILCLELFFSYKLKSERESLAKLLELKMDDLILIKSIMAPLKLWEYFYGGLII
jgi:hypothetical protein